MDGDDRHGAREHRRARGGRRLHRVDPGCIVRWRDPDVDGRRGLLRRRDAGHRTLQTAHARHRADARSAWLWAPRSPSSAHRLRSPKSAAAWSRDSRRARSCSSPRSSDGCRPAWASRSGIRSGSARTGASSRIPRYAPGTRAHHEDRLLKFRRGIRDMRIGYGLSAVLASDVPGTRRDRAAAGGAGARGRRHRADAEPHLHRADRRVDGAGVPDRRLCRHVLDHLHGHGRDAAHADRSLAPHPALTRSRPRRSRPAVLGLSRRHDRRLARPSSPW